MGDADGYIGCKVPHCQGAGEHPHLSTVRWDGEMRTLVLVLSKEMPAGSVIEFVIPRTRGLENGGEAKPPKHATAQVPLLDVVPDMHPLATAKVTRIEAHLDYNLQQELTLLPLDLCVALPLCEDGLSCAYGSDCELDHEPSSHAHTQQHPAPAHSIIAAPPRA